MKIDEAVTKVIDLAKSQVGYKPSNGKHTKYAKDLDALGSFYNTPKDGYDWCDVFFDWLFVKSFGADLGRKMLYQPLKSTGAGCPYSANFYRQNNAFSKLPQLGAQIFFGAYGDEYHTGIVVGFDSGYVYTIEGNAGGGNGEVLRKVYKRSSNSISGYGIPDWKLALDLPNNNQSKSVEEIAKEVIAGKWGNGADRINNLKAAGYDYNAIQKKVNELLKKKKSIEEIAKEVIAGKWGNGLVRVAKLKAAGYNYNDVQKKVNELLR